jgi:hypothetical protein
MVTPILHFPNLAKHSTTNNMLKRVFFQFKLDTHFSVKLFGLKDLLHKINLITLMDFGNRIFFIMDKNIYFLL